MRTSYAGRRKRRSTNWNELKLKGFPYPTRERSMPQLHARVHRRPQGFVSPFKSSETPATVCKPCFSIPTATRKVSLELVEDNI